MHTYRPVEERLRDFRPVELRLPPEILQEDIKRCQDCGIPFCHASGCALGNAIPEINAQALAGRWETALSTLLATSPFPEFTARVCPALCEGSCVQGMYDEAVSCRHVELEVVERGFARGLVQPRLPRSRLGLRVAVIGSGPSGLAAAWRLNQAGATVTVYERDASAGGFLRYGIPDFKLEKEVVDRRVEILEGEGIAFEYDVAVGRDLSGELLRRRHDAIVLATGARNKRDLPAPGRELSGIHFATDYLSAQNRRLNGELASLPPEYNAAGKRVVVVGGGDTGSDCVGTALRQGAASVLQVEIMPEPPRRRAPNNPWPEWPRIRRDSSSHQEGCERRWNISTLAFLPHADDNTRLGGLRSVRVEWLPGPDGKVQPQPQAGSEEVCQADLALLAMGFTGVEPTPLYQAVGARVDARGGIERDESGRCGDRVYAAGDAATGPSLVVRAIADGIRIADTVLTDHSVDMTHQAVGA